MKEAKMTEADREGQGLSPHWAKVAANLGQQHWDRMWDLYREAWFVGNITKYVERYRNKNGLADLRKAKNYLNKLIELEEAEERKKQAGPARHYIPGTSGIPLCGEMMRDDTHWTIDATLVTCIECRKRMTETVTKELLNTRVQAEDVHGQ